MTCTAVLVCGWINYCLLGWTLFVIVAGSVTRSILDFDLIAGWAVNCHLSTHFICTVRDYSRGSNGMTATLLVISLQSLPFINHKEPPHCLTVREEERIKVREEEGKRTKNEIRTRYVG